MCRSLLRPAILAAVLCFAAKALPLAAQTDPKAEEASKAGSVNLGTVSSTNASSADSITDGSVILPNGTSLAYTAVAGTLTVGSTDSQDANLALDGSYLPGTAGDLPGKPADQPATARMFYTAYFAKGSSAKERPVIFVYDGGPGSSSMTLRMASFGPVSVVLPSLQHPVGGPYRLENNADCLLDMADLVIIDAPGTGYSRIQGLDAPAKFYGIDQDADAFDRFLRRFLSKYDRWNSPKFLFGHSYGTTRNAVLALKLLEDGVSLNGIISVSQFLTQEDFLDAADAEPGIENPYFLALPSYAATAWFHHKVLGQPPQLESWLPEVERYALGEYASTLLAGADLTPEKKQAVAAKLESFTGIPAATWLKANLRLTGSEFEKILLEDAGLTTGRLDTRYVGLAINPMAAEAKSDPYGAANGSAILAAMNSYAHETLKFGRDLTYESDADVPGLKWDAFHVTTSKEWLGLWNVLPDLAKTLTANPKMHVLLVSGYFDLSTTYLAAIYQMKHLPMPPSLQANIEYEFYQTGHEPYVDPDVRHAMHDRIARFIEAADHR